MAVSKIKSPPQSANSVGPIKNSNNNKTKKSSLRVITEILLVLLVVEIYFYRKLSQTEYMELRELEKINAERMTKLVAPHIHIKNQKAERVARMERAKQRRARQGIKAANQAEQGKKKGFHPDEPWKEHPRWKNMTTAEQKEYRNQFKDAMHSLNVTEFDDKSQQLDEATKEDIRKTADKLRHMRVSGEVKLSELPPWSQIVENFNSYTNDDEPVILGLEQCQAFRETTNVAFLGTGPAGLFSTGTNLIQTLTRMNCEGPTSGSNMRFALVQVPWGKHNPADARFYHQVKFPKVPKREAILPIVLIRHPYTWMSAMCKHSYRTRWKHDKTKCHESLYLHNPILDVPWGFKQYNETHKVKNSYDSLAHMWKDWYKPYFMDYRFNQTPRIMVRHEDMVYRPEKVVSKICDCLGGTNRNKNPNWEHKDGFEYEEDSANRGRGHGRLSRSGLLTAVIKYGQPIRNWYDQYSASDREIMKEAFQGEQDPDLRKIFETFQYRLFDDVGEPTKAEKMRVRQRLHDEQKAKEEMAKEEAKAAKQSLAKSALEKLTDVDGNPT